MKKLEPDHAEQQTLLLAELVAIQRSPSNASSVPSSPSVNGFRPLARNIAINTLWISSLVLTLSLSVLIMLLKQWIRNYSSDLPPEIDRRERLRQFRFGGFSKWYVNLMMTYSPFLLHLALFLFLAGLVLATSSLPGTVFIISITLASISVLLYFIAGCLPVLYADCPYRTPLSRVAFGVKYLSQRAGRRLMQHQFVNRLKGLQSHDVYPLPVATTLSQYEIRAVEELGRNEVHIDLLIGLTEVPGGKYDSMAIQALGGLPLQFEYPVRKITEFRNNLSSAARLAAYPVEAYLRRTCQSLSTSPISRHVDVKALNSLVMEGRSGKETVQLNIEDFPVASLRHMTRVSRAVLYTSSREKLTTFIDYPYYMYNSR
jgi:hypothetical protein